MRSEMDIFKMTEHERMCWLRANRVTLITVGIVWIGMIFQRLSTENSPWFLMAMVPIFALFRFAAYLFYKRTTK